MNLHGAKALITGASRGLGREVALRLASEGASVALVARGEGALREVAEVVRRAGGTAVEVPGDLGSPDDVARVAALAQHELGRVDVVVHAAATLGQVPLPLLLDLDPAALEDSLRVNVAGPFRLARALVAPMVVRGGGVFVAISSDAATGAYPRWGAYAAGKAAFDVLIHTLGAELEGTGVHLISHDPGEMDTAMHAAAVPDADPSTLTSPGKAADRLVALLKEV